MRRISPTQSGIAVGSVVGIWHLLWVVLVGLAGVVIPYVLGAAVFVHGVHLLGRRYHLFSGPVPDRP